MIAQIVQFVPLALVASVPLLLAVEGEMIVERSGIINLGIEGMMLAAALSAVVAAQSTGSVALGFAGGIAGAAILSACFGFFVIQRRADPIVTGTATNLLALGLTGFLARESTGNGLLLRPLPRLHRDLIAPFAWLVVPIVLATLLWNTPFGLRLRACGENPAAVTGNGFSVSAHRWLALMIETVLVGVGGAYLSLILSSGFAENMTAGRGFIALSIVIFGRWSFRGAILGTAVFGMAAAAQYAIQASGRGIPFHLLLAVPYAVTLLLLCGIAGRVLSPEALGKREG